MGSASLRRFAPGFLALATTLAAPALAGVLPVSPGASDRLVEATSACPTFSWSGADDALAYELAVLDVSEPEAPQLVFSQRIEGAGDSWTPSRDRCLASGRTYAWLVRAEIAGPGLGEWSAPRLFRVPGEPTAEEVDAALALLARWRAAQPRESGAAGAGERVPVAGRLPSRDVEQVTAEPDAPLASGVAAVRGEIPDVTGNAYGVLGITSSPQGAGVVARNQSAGADLILDGEAQGEPDTLFTQSGLDRPSASGATFNFQNSGAGALTLQVDGIAVDTTNTPIDWARVANVPAGFADGVDNDTTYAAGNQLQLAGTTFNVLEGPGSGLDADTLDGLQAAAVQTRVTGVCPEGQAIRGVNSDGSVACYVVPVPPMIATVVSNGVVGVPSIAIGADGLPVISFLSGGGPCVAKCFNATCTERMIRQLGYSTYGRSSIAVGGDGLPVISYQDTESYSLKIARCEDPWCDEFLPHTVDDPENLLGPNTSIAIGIDGFPVISYQDYTARALKFVKCANASCTSHTIRTVWDDANDVAGYSSVAIGGDGFPLVAFSDQTNGWLRLAKCLDVSCESHSNYILAAGPGAGSHNSIAVGSDGFGVIGWHDSSSGALRVIKCNNRFCNNITQSSVDGPPNWVGGGNSIAIGIDGLPVLSYLDSGAHALRTAKCNDAACAGGDEIITLVDDPGNWIEYGSSIVIGVDGLPVIAYTDFNAGALKVAKCMNPSCRY